MRDDDVLLRLLSPSNSGENLSILSAEPSGRDFTLKVQQGSKIFRANASEFREYVDASTGEILEDSVSYMRKLWAADVCRRNGGTWPLGALIWALQIDGVGPATASAIARALKTWDNFLLALKQLKSIDVPASRDEIINAVGEEYWKIGRLNDFDPSRALDAYPEPLSILMREGVSGPKTWSKMRLWIDSPSAEVTITQLLEFGGAPSPKFGILAGQVIAFSGTFESCTRIEAKAIAERMGARVTGLPTPDVTMLVSGAGASSSKLKTAKRLGIKICSEAEWLSFLKSSGAKI